MVGTIRKRDILAHPIVSIRCFGLWVFFRALFAGKNQTFLSLLTDIKGLKPSPEKVPELVERCIKLELQAKQIYERLAGQFVDHECASNFFRSLARHEESHAQLLELCREIANRTIWRESRFTPYRDSIPRLERQMETIESSMELIEHVVDGLRLVIDIEGSEVNQVFGSVVAAGGSNFVKNLVVFQVTVEKHIDFICDEIPKLEPDTKEKCEQLRSRFFIGVE